MLDDVAAFPLAFSSFARRLAACAWLAFLVNSGGCARQEGAVELDWSIVDGNFDDLFPGQRYTSSCALENLGKLRLASADPANPSGQVVDVDLKLQVRLRVFDCPSEQSGEQCQLAPPVKEQVFDCDHMRGTIGKLTSLEHSYLFVVDTLMTPNLPDAASIVPKQSCVATPGIRRRLIRAGQIANLAVYQVVIQATPDRPLIINDCAVNEGTTGDSSSGPQSTTTQDATSTDPGAQGSGPPPGIAAQ